MWEYIHIAKVTQDLHASFTSGFILETLQYLVIKSLS